MAKGGGGINRIFKATKVQGCNNKTLNKILVLATNLAPSCYNIEFSGYCDLSVYIHTVAGFQQKNPLKVYCNNYNLIYLNNF